jgi:hypothetical protein
MKRILLVLASVAALWSASCNGSGSTTVTPPPPTGKYTPGSLNGQYAFVTSGEVFASGSQTALGFARLGSFVADGKGGISGGVEDTNTQGVIVNQAVQITGGSYTVQADGRGTLTLNITSNGSASSVNFGIVLTSTSAGLLIDETANGNQISIGSGNFVLQTRAGSYSISSVNGPYVFDFSGTYPDQNNGPASLVGQFQVNAGVIAAGGVEDVNNSGTFTTAGTVAGSFQPDPFNASTLATFGRGVAQINGLNYVFYVVDATRVRFLAIDVPGSLAGDAVAQATPASPSGGFVFIVAGANFTSGITRVGRFTVNGTSLSNVYVDTNNSGSFIKTDSVSNAMITLDAANPGRGTGTFTDPAFPKAPFTFVFYLSSPTAGVIQETTVANNLAVDVADGSIAAQTGSPFSGSNISGTYALNWSGLSSPQNNTPIDEEDFVAQATVSNLAVTGVGDLFQFSNGTLQTDVVAAGPIAISGDGTGDSGNTTRNTMTLKLTSSKSETLDFVIYFASPRLAFFVDKDNNQGTTRIVAGVLNVQQ